MGKVKPTCCVCGKEIYRWPYQIRDSDNHCCCDSRCFGKTRIGVSPTNKAELVGQKFGMLTVIEYAGVRKGHRLWRCRCDCGNETFVTTGSLRYGTIQSCGCLLRRRGSAHPNWRQGFTITPDGYKEIPKAESSDAHRYRREHRAVMEAMLGRPLTSREIVHHINQDKTDNRFENLQVMTRAEHGALHAALAAGELMI